MRRSNQVWQVVDQIDGPVATWMIIDTIVRTGALRRRHAEHVVVFTAPNGRTGIDVVFESSGSEWELSSDMKRVL